MKLVPLFPVHSYNRTRSSQLDWHLLEELFGEAPDWIRSIIVEFAISTIIRLGRKRFLLLAIQIFHLIRAFPRALLNWLTYHPSFQYVTLTYSLLRTLNKVEYFCGLKRYAETEISLMKRGNFRMIVRLTLYLNPTYKYVH